MTPEIDAVNAMVQAVATTSGSMLSASVPLIEYAVGGFVALLIIFMLWIAFTRGLEKALG